MGYDKPLVGIVGNLGKDPEIKSTSKGDITKFTVFESHGFGPDAPESTRYAAAIFNEGLQEWAQENLKSGSAVAVQGTITKNDRGYPDDLMVVRIGRVEWGTRTKREDAPAPTPVSDDGDF